MPLNTMQNPGLNDLLNQYQNPLQKKKQQFLNPQTNLKTTLTPSVQQPVQNPAITVPSVQQPTLPQPNKTQQPVAKSTQTTLPQSNELKPLFADATQPSQPDQTAPDSTTPTSTTANNNQANAIDWGTTKVQGSDLSVNDWFTNNTIDIEQARQQRQTIISNAAKDLYNKLSGTNTEYGRITTDGKSVLGGMSLEQFTNMLINDPNGLRNALGENAKNADFPLLELGGYRQHVYAAFDAIQSQLSNALSGIPNLDNVGTNGAKPTIFRDEKGRAIAQGYIIDGKTYIIKDLRRIAESLSDAQNTDIPTLDEWMQDQGHEFTDIMDSDAWQGIQDMIDQLRDPANQAEWVSGGLDQAGRVLGLGGEAGYQERVGGLADLLQGGINGQQGFTPEETDLQNRQLMSDIRQAREETKLIIESLGAGGRSAQALVSADNISSQIGNMQIQYRLKIAEQNYARQQAQFDAEMQQYQFMVQTGQMNVSDYIQKQRENAAMQLSVYGQEVNMIESSNAQYLQEYSADMQAIQAHAQAIYNGIMAEMGLDQSLYEQMQNEYEMAMAPYTQALQNISLMEERIAADNQSRMQMFSAILGMMGTGADIVAAIASGKWSSGSNLGKSNNTATTPNNGGYGA